MSEEKKTDVQIKPPATVKDAGKPTGDKQLAEKQARIRAAKKTAKQ